MGGIYDSDLEIKHVISAQIPVPDLSHMAMQERLGNVVSLYVQEGREMSLLYKLASLCPSDQSPLSSVAGVDARHLGSSA